MKDIYSYSLGYFDGDYNSINTFASNECFLETGVNTLPVNTTSALGHKDLYNGNISSMFTTLTHTPTCQCHKQVYIITTSLIE